jgi:hypothetical protein
MALDQIPRCLTPCWSQRRRLRRLLGRILLMDVFGETPNTAGEDARAPRNASV